MEKINLTFLGTSDSMPTKSRNHTAILLNYKNENILIDCGEGTQRQFKIAGLSLAKLTKILISHWHGDHILGLPGLFQTLGMLGYQKTLHVYGPIGTKRKIEQIKEFVNVEINVQSHEIENSKIDCKDFEIKVSSMSHTSPCNAYSFIIKDKIRLNKTKLKKLKLPNSPLLKQLKQGKDVIHNDKKIKSSQVTYLQKGKKITFIFDTAINQNAIELAKNSDLLITGSQFSTEEHENAKKFKHLTAKDAAEIAKKAKAKKLFLTHISQRYEGNFKKIEKEAKKLFKNAQIAKDFQKIFI